MSRRPGANAAASPISGPATPWSAPDGKPHNGLPVSGTVSGVSGAIAGLVQWIRKARAAEQPLPAPAVKVVTA